MRQILLIEDSEADQYIFKYFMKKKKPDVEILVADDGDHALKILAELEQEPDLILLDINMPIMNGHEFLKKYTNSNERKIPIVVMLTSSEQEYDQEQAFAYKCVKKYLVKPFKPEYIDVFSSLFEN